MGNNFSCFKQKKEKSKETVGKRIRKCFRRKKPTKIIDVAEELNRMNGLGKKDPSSIVGTSGQDSASEGGSGEAAPRLPSPNSSPEGRVTPIYRPGAVTPLPPDESMLDVICLNTNNKSEDEDDGVQPMPSKMPRPKAAKGLRKMPTVQNLALFQAENEGTGKKMNHLDRRLRPKAAKGARTPHVGASIDLYLPGSTQNTKTFPREDGELIVPPGQILRQTEEQRCLNEWMKRCRAREELEDF